MGYLEKGQWIKEKLIPEAKDGEFKRPAQSFRECIGGDAVEKNRYHLYVSYACPWAHRALIMLRLKKLEDLIDVSVVSPKMMDDGWTFATDFPGATGDKLLHQKFLRDIYTTADPDFSGKVTVPVLFDSMTKKIVNNESSEVIRIMNKAFDHVTGNKEDFYPDSCKDEIDSINEDIYENINNGVYRTGFATHQRAYELSFDALFAALDRVEKKLQGKTFLVRERLTEADIRLFTTLVRFDPVYYVHFKCNRTMIREFKNLASYLARLYEIPAFKETTYFDHIKTHYYYSHRQFNPYGIIARGPQPLVERV